ncbi:hypothetical protein LCGC14_3089100, partial [marine sediment metagenome]
MLKTAVRDSGWKNFVRRVPKDSVLYYPGLKGGTTTVEDYSGNAYAGTISGATWERQANEFWVNGFDGIDDFIQATSDFGDINFLTQAITLECVWRWDTGTPASGGILGISPATATNLGIQLVSNEVGRLWLVWVRRDGDVTSRVPLLLDDTLSLNQWYHIIASYSGNGTPNSSSVDILLNGTARTFAESGQRHFWDVNNVVRIGSQALTGAGGVQEPIDGLIGLVNIRDQTTSLEEMQDRFQHIGKLIGV